MTDGQGLPTVTIMKRTLFGMALVLVLTVGVGLGAGFHLSTVRNRPAVATDDRVSTSDGRLSVDRPAGWVEIPCPTGRHGCLQISPPGAGDGDRVTVTVEKLGSDDQDPMEYYLSAAPPGGFVDRPSFRRLTIDGAEAFRLDPDWSPGPAQHGPAAPDPAIVVFGRVTATQEAFAIDCRYDRQKAEIRSGCDLMVASLRISR